MHDRIMLNAFERFYEIALESKWTKPQDITNSFNNSDLITCKQTNSSRIVLNIGANKYRMVVGYYFATKQTYLYVKFIGTHKEYDKIDVCKIDMFKSK